jgi:catechol 2,3-dioxygenase-like lactoylglutathione lyase family enzyme
MYDHIGLKVKDVAASVRFYTAALKPLGLELDGSGTGFGAPGAPALWLYADKAARTGIHLALKAPDRAAVGRFHQAGMKAGGRDNGAPGLRTDYAPNYYAAFLLDPDGNNVEAVCME